MPKELEIWAEKYRPKKIDDLIDQEHVKERVKLFLKEKNIPHLLFAGPPGTGKTTLALVIARELYGDQWKSNVLQLNASISKDTPILVKINGKIKRTNFEKLDKMFFEKNEEYKKVENLEVLTYSEGKIKWEKVNYLIRHKVEKILEVKFEGGGKIKLTGNHSVFVFTENGIEIKQASELKKGDYLISFVTKIEENNSKQLEKYKVYGLYAAEGSVYFQNYSGQVIFTFGYPKEMQLANYVANFYSNLNPRFNLVGSGFNRERKSAIQVRIHNKKLAEFYKQNFYENYKELKTKNKRIPSFVFEASLDERISFIRGLIEGDGTGKWNKVCRLISRSNEMLIDFVWLCRISGLESSIFKNEARIIWKDSMKYKKSDLILAKPFINFFEKIKKKIKCNWKYLLRHQLYGKRSERISKEVLRKIFEKIEVEKLSENERKEYELLKSIAFSDIHVLKIKDLKIIDYNDYVYDVSVPKTQAFFAGNIPILLHNSDERGIDVIRGKVKEFARTYAVGDVPFKLIIMDEADAMTAEAQQALRRMMEDYSSVTRFILCCNYSSKIIEPIQSRCAVFRFKALPEKAQREYIERIVKGEKLKIDEDAIQAIVTISEGDLRKVANLLQAAAAIAKEKITADDVYEAASLAKPKEVEEMLNLALKGDVQSFQKARELLHKKLLIEGLAGEDLIKEIYRQALRLNIPEDKKIQLIEKIGEYEFRISEGGDPLIQLTALLAQISLLAKK